MENVKLDKSKFLPKFGEWGRYFEPIFETDILDNIYSKLKSESLEGKLILPHKDNTFKTFIATPPKDLKVVFLLLDPYPTLMKGEIIANGIAMDCSNTKVLQPSLSKWYDAIEKDQCKGLNLNMIQSPSLEFYYNQGIMFLNTALTVEYNKTGSHLKLWEPFMRWTFENVLSNFTGIIYVLCGEKSHNFEKWISPLGNYIFKIEHPSAAARRLRDWDHKDIFNTINRILKLNNNTYINWVDEEAPF